MPTDKQYRGYTLEEIFWWVKRLSENFSMRIEAGEFRLVFSHKSCGTQELYGKLWTIAKNALDALKSAIKAASSGDLEAYAEEFPQSESV
jgi:hypothetical protein